ncbi:anti-Muellerian hormone type-2 receptor-like isoform X3 [Gadus morhua]|uniref:anti-Muellerian hormone type-2 receptor-like isoform X3 n=1 Tax=Gadus morhua TaxID=8049 RepID=UPI0011B5B6A8|nr:anti-Muellerian hormone type-2 receptor isoform X3 [Gadus morhua]
MRQPQWLLIAVVECLFLCISGHCAYHNRKYITRNIISMHAGNVTELVHRCSSTKCCASYFRLVGNQAEVMLEACPLDENCQKSFCKPNRDDGRWHELVIKCGCKEGRCNKSSTWSPTLSPRQNQLQPSFHTVDKVSLPPIFITVGTVLFVFIMLIAVGHLWRHLFKEHEEENLSCVDGEAVLPLCSCRTATPRPINSADLEIQQAIGRGHFAKVWQGKYQGSVVAVKVFHAGCKQEFSSERDIYELPLMEHSGIARFFGAGKSLDGGSWLLVLELATCGSLHHLLCDKRGSWMASMKLSQSLSQGLAYLHSDLHRQGTHKPVVAHGDLSSGNVLVRADGTCALSDFGCSTILRSCSGRPGWDSLKIIADCGQVGSLRYMSPEILEGCVDQGWSLVQADVYSLGLLLWEIWMRCSDLFEDGMVHKHTLPYETELGSSVTLERLLLYVSQMNKRPSIPKRWERETQGALLQELVTDCWDHEPDARLTAQCVVGRLHALQTIHSV